MRRKKLYLKKKLCYQFIFLPYMIREIIILIASTVAAVLFPRLAPFLAMAMYKVMNIGVHPAIIICLCSTIATCTTWVIWYLDNRIHAIFDRQRKNLPNEKSRTWRARRWFDQTFTLINNKTILFIAIAIGSASFIPDFFLVEFWRIKMKVKPFLTAIFFGKVLTYLILLYWLNLLNTMIHFFL
jgi:membrane protein YqaA with SNARE-associated domain